MIRLAWPFHACLLRGLAKDLQEPISLSSVRFLVECEGVNPDFRNSLGKITLQEHVTIRRLQCAVDSSSVAIEAEAGYELSLTGSCSMTAFENLQ